MSVKRQVQSLQRERVQTWIRTPMLVAQTQVVQIIGGQTVSGVDVIQYEVSDPTLTQTYDPDVDTAYPSGIGRGWLMDGDGHPLRRVLIRHDFAGMPQPIVGGWVYVIGGTVSLTVASGPDVGTAMLFYRITWPV